MVVVVVVERILWRIGLVVRGVGDMGNVDVGGGWGDGDQGGEGLRMVLLIPFVGVIAIGFNGGWWWELKKSNSFPFGQSGPGNVMENHKTVLGLD